MKDERWFLDDTDPTAPDRIVQLLETYGYTKVPDNSHVKTLDRSYSICREALICFYHLNWGFVYTVRFPEKETGLYSWGVGSPQYGVRREYRVTFETFEERLKHETLR